MTVLSPRRSRAATIWSSTANASADASRSCSPLPTTARSWSDETTSCGRYRCAAQADLPDPEGPTSTTSAGSGTAGPAVRWVSSTITSVADAQPGRAQPAALTLPDGPDPPRMAAMSEPSATSFPVTTAFELQGLTIEQNLGVAFGLVVRSMGFAKSVGAGFKALRQGEVTQYTELLEDSRRHAIDRMIDNARLLGANAVVAMRFDSSEIGQQLTEIVAYGTAVVAGPGT
jgi:uncharacterized protein YbjQ (UPF0145 family)